MQFTIHALSARRHVQIKASSCEAVQRGARLLHEELGWLRALGTTLLLEGLLTLALFKELPFDFNQFLVYCPSGIEDRKTKERSTRASEFKSNGLTA